MPPTHPVLAISLGLLPVRDSKNSEAIYIDAHFALLIYFGPWTERSGVPPFVVYDPLPAEFYRLSVIATNATRL